MRKNEAGQVYSFVARQTDNTAITTGVSGSRILDNGTSAAITGTLTHKGTGWWTYSSSAADTNGDFVSLRFTATDMVEVVFNFDTRIERVDVRFWNGVPQTIDGAGKASVGVEAWAGSTTAVKLDAVNSLPEVTSALIGAVGINSASFANNAITASAIANNALDDKGNWLQPVTAGRKLVVSTNNSAKIDFDLAVGTLSSGQFDNNALNGKGDWNIGKTGYSLTTGERTAIATAVGDDPVETGLNIRQSHQLANAANAGILAGALTASVTIRDRANTKNRITATVDGDGNRTAVSVNLD